MYRLWTIGWPEQRSLFNQDVTLFGRNETGWCRRSGDCLPRVAVVYRPCLPGITATGVSKHSLAGDTSGKYCWFTFEFSISFWLLSRRLQFDMWFFVCLLYFFVLLCRFSTEKKTPFTNGGIRYVLLYDCRGKGNLVLYLANWTLGEKRYRFRDSNEYCSKYITS